MLSKNPECWYNHNSNISLYIVRFIKKVIKELHLGDQLTSNNTIFAEKNRILVK